MGHKIEYKIIQKQLKWNILLKFQFKAAHSAHSNGPRQRVNCYIWQKSTKKVPNILMSTWNGVTPIKWQKPEWSVFKKMVEIQG